MRTARSIAYMLVAVLLVGCVAIPEAATQPVASPSPSASELATSSAPSLEPTRPPTATPVATGPSETIRPSQPTSTATPPTPSPAAGTPEPTATATISRWSRPERIAAGAFRDISFVIDEAGVAHAAASIERDGIFYLTNASGDWKMQRLTEAPGEGRSSGHDELVWLGLDRDGSLAVAFQRYERWECDPFRCDPREPESAYLLTGVAGTWSSPVDLPFDLPTSLAFIDGHLHHAFAEDGEASQSVFYETDASGSWTRELIGEAGGWPQLMLASDGTARIAFNGVDRHLYLATQQQDGSFALADVSDTPRYGLMLDASDSLHSSWYEESGDEPPGERYTRLENGSWTEPVLTYPADRSLTDPCDKRVGSTLWSDDAAIGDDGSVYAISRNDPLEAGLWYSTNRTGQFVATQLRPPSYWSPEICDVAVEGFHDRPAQLELDHDGRPHVLFLDGEGLFYTVGPSN